MTAISDEPRSGDALHPIGARRVLVLAAHPGDEILGCAGAMRRHVDAGATLRVVIVADETGPDDGAAPTPRTGHPWSESRRAAQLLGYPDPEPLACLGGRPQYGEDLVCRLGELIVAFEADLVYAVSEFEDDADRHALAWSAMEAVRRRGDGLQLALYPVQAALPQANVVLDAAGLPDRKEQHLSQFAPMRALAANRAEAYWLTSAEALRSDPLRIHPAGHWRRERSKAPLCPAPARVSVVVRSVDRPFLVDALDSLALQTYPEIEVLVVDARASAHSELGTHCGRHPLKLIGTGQPLERSRAANVGLDRATGDYVLFLDDDDWLAPDHVAGLVAALQGNPACLVAYAGVGVRDRNRNEMGVAPFNADYSAARLRGGNYIPIHAMLFSRLLVQRGARFDESFTVYEDWDFVLQLSGQTDFVHVDAVSAYYRASGTSGVGIHADEVLQRDSRRRIYDKWCRAWSGAQVDEMLQAAVDIEHDKQVRRQEVFQRETREQIEQAHAALTEAHRELDAVHAAYREADAERARSRSRATELEAQLDRAASGLATSEARIRELSHAVEGLEARLAERDLQLEVANGRLFDLLHSTSWRATAPLRWVGTAGPRLKRLAIGSLAAALGRRAWPAGAPEVSQGFQGESIGVPVSTGKRPLVSVVMPVYNACRADKRYLQRAIDSIARQTYRHVELVVVDDGSTDDTQALCREYLACHPDLRAQILSKPNGGQSDARNFGAKACRGEYIGFLDQDDEWYENKLELVVPWLEDDRIDVLYTDADSIDGNDQVTLACIHKQHLCGWPHPKKSVEDILFKDIFVMPGLMTIKKTAFDRVGGFDAKLSGYEDDDLFLRLSETCRVFYLPTPTLRWRMYGENYSFSHRMLASRSYYWRKLLEHYTDGGKDRFRSHMISLRFFWEFLNQSILQYRAGSDLCWASLSGAKEISPYLPRIPRTLFSAMFLLPDRWVLGLFSRAKGLTRGG